MTDKGRWVRVPICVVLCCVLLAGHQSLPVTPIAAASSPVVSPSSPTGSYANGTLLPDGRLVTPAGELHDLGDFPLGLAISPDGTLAVAINSGQGNGLNNGFPSDCTQGNGGKPCPYTNPPDPRLAAAVGDRTMHAPDESLIVINLRTGYKTQVTAVPTTYDPDSHGSGTFNFFYCGVVFSPNGKHLYAAGGGNDAIYDFPVAGDVVGPTPLRTVTLPSGVPSFIGSGITKSLAVTADGRYLLVSHELNDSLDVVDTTTYAVHSISLALPFLGDGYPYGVAVSHSGRVAYVALQGAGSVAVVDLRDGSGTVRSRIHVGDHPTALALSPDGTQLYVANANDDTLSIVTTGKNRLVATIPLHVLAGEAPGASPDGLAVSPDGQRVYVALAGDNAVAVLGTQQALAGTTLRSSSASPAPTAFKVGGFIPGGWYPSAVAVSPSGGTVYIVSAKGLGSRPTAITSDFEYVGNNMPGLFQAVSTPGSHALATGSESAAADIQYAATVDNRRSAHNPIPALAGGYTPIQHVLLVVRENRTFDQVLGDLGADQGRTRTQVDGEPIYAIFGRETTPNAHALVGDPLPGSADPAFATSDNFYSNGEASIQGHYWTSSANVTDYIEKSWRLYYSPRHHLQDPLSAIAEPRACSIFQSALKRQTASRGAFTFHDYGEPIGIANPGLIASALSLPGNASPGVAEHCAPIPAADVSFGSGSIFSLDSDNRANARVYLANNGLNPDGSQVKGSAARLRNFSYLILPGDHTGGLSFANTPRSRVAQNDAGLGMIVQALSHSTYWSSTAIFVMEDDSQDGLDHRDGHRNVLYVISPYAKHVGPDGKPGYVGHFHYSQTSVLKTIDLLMGFPYLSTYDQNSSPLYNLFQNKDAPAQLTAADLRPFTLQAPPSFIDETSARYIALNLKSSAVPAAESRTLNLKMLDSAGPMLEVIAWQLAKPVAAVPQPLVKELHDPRSTSGAFQDPDGF
jgi:YVTN family beta-propeller protein